MPERVGGVDVYPAGPGLCELDPGYGAARLVAKAAASPCTPETVAALARIDPASLDGEARVDLIVAWERAASMVAAHQQRALASVVDATTSVGMAGEAARFEVGAALRLSPHTAADRTMVAAALTGPLTDTLDALTAGRISYLQAAAIATTVDGLDPDVVTAVQDKVLDQADDLTVAETRTALRRAVIAADPEAAADRYQKARKERSIDPYPLPDAMTGWWVTAPAADADAAFDALTARAHTAKHALQTAGEDDPGIDALRVDVLLALTTGTPLPGTNNRPRASNDTPSGSGSDNDTANVADAAGAAGLPRCRCGGRRSAAVIIDLPTLLGLANNPGELPGYGPIPPALARQLAADTDWTRWTTHPHTGALLDTSPHTYRPRPALAAHLTARDRTCGFPGCNRPAQACDLDHVIEYTLGGRTLRLNLGPLCRTHHNAKTHGGWRLKLDPQTGDKTWTSPLGKTYRKHRPDRTGDPPHETPVTSEFREKTRDP